MQVFLSYPSERLKVAREVYGFLTSVDVDAWFDKESLVAGQDWNRERSEAQKRADLTVLICSPETIERAGVIQREVQDILDLLKDKPMGSIYLVSVLTEDVRLPSELARYHYVNYFERGWKIKLGRAIELKYKQINVPVPDRLRVIFEDPKLPEISTMDYFHKNELLNAEAEYFTYNLDGEYWSYVNATIISSVFGEFYATKMAYAEKMFDYPSEWSISVEEFFRLDELISIVCLPAGFGVVRHIPATDI